MLETDMTRVGIVDFEGVFDDRLAEKFSQPPVKATYATAWILEKGDTLEGNRGTQVEGAKTSLPTSLQLAAGLAARNASLTTYGEETVFDWKVSL